MRNGKRNTFVNLTASVDEALFVITIAGVMATSVVDYNCKIVSFLRIAIY